jgi:diguanylate cyclase (GGDEF)-like protein
MEKSRFQGDTEDMVQLAFFVEIGKAISKARSIEETLNEVMRQIGEIFMPLNWSLLLRDPKTGELTFTIAVGKNSAKLQGLQLPRGEGIAGWIAETGQALIVEDVSKDPRFSKRVDTFTGFNTESIIGVPLKSNERVFGVVELINKINGAPFTALDLKVLTTIADFAGIAIEKAYYFRALKRMATVDPVTGVNNRACFERYFARDVELSKRYGAKLSLMLVDVDDFKKINDTYGHAAGDRVLRSVAQLLVNTVRKVDSVCRWGGDEFVVLLPETSKEHADEVRRRILERIDYQNSLGQETPYRVSIGLHSIADGRVEGLFEFLDQDLYRQKVRKHEINIEHVEYHLEEMLREEKTWRTAQKELREQRIEPEPHEDEPPFDS